MGSLRLAIAVVVLLGVVSALSAAPKPKPAALSIATTKAPSKATTTKPATKKRATNSTTAGPKYDALTTHLLKKYPASALSTSHSVVPGSGVGQTFKFSSAAMNKKKWAPVAPVALAAAHPINVGLAFGGADNVGNGKPAATNNPP
eukprot:g3625.t1